MTNDKLKPRRGFAAMDPTMQRAISSKGGKVAAASGNAYRWNAETSKLANAKRKPVDPAHMARIGRIGGHKSAVSRALKKQQTNPHGDK